MCPLFRGSAVYTVAIYCIVKLGLLVNTCMSDNQGRQAFIILDLLHLLSL